MMRVTVRGAHNAPKAKGRKLNENYVSHFVAPHKGINERFICRAFTKMSWLPTIELLKPVNPQPDVPTYVGCIYLLLGIFFFLLSR